MSCRSTPWRHGVLSRDGGPNLSLIGLSRRRPIPRRWQPIRWQFMHQRRQKWRMGRHRQRQLLRGMRRSRRSKKIVCWMLASKGGPKSRRRHDIIGLALTCSRTFVTFEVPSLLTFDLAARQKVCTDDASWSFETWEVVVAKNGMLAEASQRHRGDAAGNRPHDTPGHVLLLQ
mmetsp:Transcript_92459/g.239386  ORF Transcript_92459/g.239386 Transcript_92459/m.239386 type:complete len:173 (-) Transcript_92459:62-580(-)